MYKKYNGIIYENVKPTNAGFFGNFDDFLISMEDKTTLKIPHVFEFCGIRSGKRSNIPVLFFSLAILFEVFYLFLSLSSMDVFDVVLIILPIVAILIDVIFVLLFEYFSIKRIAGNNKAKVKILINQFDSGIAHPISYPNAVEEKKKYGIQCFIFRFLTFLSLLISFAIKVYTSSEVYSRTDSIFIFAVIIFVLIFVFHFLFTKKVIELFFYNKGVKKSIKQIIEQNLTAPFYAEKEPVMVLLENPAIRSIQIESQANIDAINQTPRRIQENIEIHEVIYNLNTILPNNGGNLKLWIEKDAANTYQLKVWNQMWLDDEDLLNIINALDANGLGLNQITKAFVLCRLLQNDGIV